MVVTYDEYFEKIQAYAQKSGLADFRLAREEFHNLTGKFEDSEPWFETRMTMFLDWFILDRPGPGGLTPVEQYLVDHAASMETGELRELIHLTVTMRSVFELREIEKDNLWVLDIVRGGQWLITTEAPIVGLNEGDIFSARIFFSCDKVRMGKGIVLHPKDAHGTIKDIVARARAEGFSLSSLVDQFDMMKLKLERYSNVKIQHVYRYPSDVLF